MGSVSSGSSLLSMDSDDSNKNPYQDIDFVNDVLPTYKEYPGLQILQRPGSRRLVSARVAAVAALVLSTLCFLFVAGCAVIFCYKVNQGSFEGHASGDEGMVCLPCIQVNPDPLQEAPYTLLEALDRQYDAEKDTDICCARTPAQYAALFKLILKRQEGVKKLADILGAGNSGNEGVNTPYRPARNSSSVSAHLLIKPTGAKQSLTTSRDQPLQQWKSPEESPFSHVREGLRFHDNKVFVSLPGLYFVYCQILYMHAGDGDTSEPQVASNYVKRTSVLYPGISGILLKSRHTRYNQESDRHSSYVGGLFFLHEGDALYVQVSEPGLISHDDTASFFGLFRVGE